MLIVNALPLPEGFWAKIAARYPRGIVTIEDGLIATPETGLRGFAGLASSALGGAAPAEHIGIVDPRVAPSDGHMEVWEHFGLTAAACVEAAKSLG